MNGEKFNFNLEKAVIIIQAKNPELQLTTEQATEIYTNEFDQNLKVAVDYILNLSQSLVKAHAQQQAQSQAKDQEQEQKQPSQNANTFFVDIDADNDDSKEDNNEEDANNNFQNSRFTTNDDDTSPTPTETETEQQQQQPSEQAQAQAQAHGQKQGKGKEEDNNDVNNNDDDDDNENNEDIDLDDNEDDEDIDLDLDVANNNVTANDAPILSSNNTQVSSATTNIKPLYSLLTQVQKVCIFKFAIRRKGILDTQRINFLKCQIVHESPKLDLELTNSGSRSNVDYLKIIDEQKVGFGHFELDILLRFLLFGELNKMGSNRYKRCLVLSDLYQMRTFGVALQSLPQPQHNNNNNNNNKNSDNKDDDIINSPSPTTNMKPLYLLLTLTVKESKPKVCVVKFVIKRKDNPTERISFLKCQIVEESPVIKEIVREESGEDSQINIEEDSIGFGYFELDILLQFLLFGKIELRSDYNYERDFTLCAKYKLNTFEVALTKRVWHAPPNPKLKRRRLKVLPTKQKTRRSKTTNTTATNSNSSMHYSSSSSASQTQNAKLNKCANKK